MCLVYYNENDKFAAQWLRNLISAGLIAKGDVDERDIRNVRADDLRGYSQCHFFGGIAGWPRALQLAGWDKPCWTGSCPCAPFSVGGKKKKCPVCQSANIVSHVGRTGYFVCCQCQHEWLADSRHLWPEMWRLISAGRPRYFFGEQVAGSDGETWFASVRASLEILRYDVRAASLNAAGVGAPHIRQRLWWVARSVGHVEHDGPPGERKLGGTEEKGRLRELAGSGKSAGELADSDSGRPQRAEAGTRQGPFRDALRWGAVCEFWSDVGWIPCRDGKIRPAEPGVNPLVDGVSKRVGRGCDPGAPFDANATAEGRKGRLIGYGNAIVPQVGAEFIRACMESAALRVASTSTQSEVHKPVSRACTMTQPSDQNAPVLTSERAGEVFPQPAQPQPVTAPEDVNIENALSTADADAIPTQPAAITVASDQPENDSPHAINPESGDVVTRQMSPNLVTLITTPPTFESVSDFVNAYEEKNKIIAGLTGEFVVNTVEAKQKQDEILPHLAYMQGLLSKKGANHDLVIAARKQKHNIPWWTTYYATYKDKLWESLRTMERRIASFRKDPSVATKKQKNGTRPKYLTQLEHRLLGTATNIHEALADINAGHIEEAIQKLGDDLPTLDRIQEHLERGVKPTHAKPDGRAGSAADELATALASELDRDVASKMLTEHLRAYANQFANGRIKIKEVTAKIEFAGRDERIMPGDWLAKREKDAGPRLCKCVGVAEFMKRRRVQEWSDGKWQKEHVVYSADERDYTVITQDGARKLTPEAFPSSPKTPEGL